MGKKKLVPSEEPSSSSKKILKKNGKFKNKVPNLVTLFKCDICNKEFSNRGLLVSHQNIHSTNIFGCPQCSYRGKTKKYLSRHIKQVHKEIPEKHKCKFCGKFFLHQSGLKVHEMVHTGVKPHSCNVCGKTFRVTYSLNSHMLIHTNEKPFQCSFCSYACRDSSTLRKHQNKHMGLEKIYECKICNKGYKNRAALKIHIAETHLDVDMRKFPCDRCDRVFKNNAHRQMHINSIHERALVCNCPICGRRLMNKNNLTAHLRTHLDERPFSCTHHGCSLAFKDKNSLTKHSVIHNPKLHHACAYCGRKFVRKTHVQRHERVMHVERKRGVECHYCGSRFYSKNYLLKHIQTKHIYKQKFKYICDICGLVTHNKPSIVMHLKYGHSNDNDMQCKICDSKIVYKRHMYLKLHYWKTHNIRYKITRKPTRTRAMMKAKEEKASVEIKVEPIEADSYEEIQLLDVHKKETEDDPNEYESLDYSKRVLSEDITKSALSDRGHNKEVEFDDFFIRHVFSKQEVTTEDEVKNDGVDEEQNQSVKRRIKQILLRSQKLEKAKVLRNKRKLEEKLQREKKNQEAKLKAEKEKQELIELRRVREMYNERMKVAVAKEKEKKERIKIKYFKKKPEDLNKTKTVTEENNDENTKNNDENVENISVEAEAVSEKCIETSTDKYLSYTEENDRSSENLSYSTGSIKTAQDEILNDDTVFKNYTEFNDDTVIEEQTVLNNETLLSDDTVINDETVLNDDTILNNNTVCNDDTNLKLNDSKMTSTVAANDNNELNEEKEVDNNKITNSDQIFAKIDTQSKKRGSNDITDICAKIDMHEIDKSDSQEIDDIVPGNLIANHGNVENFSYNENDKHNYDENCDKEIAKHCMNIENEMVDIHRDKNASCGNKTTDHVDDSKNDMNDNPFIGPLEEYPTSNDITMDDDKPTLPSDNHECTTMKTCESFDQPLLERRVKRASKRNISNSKTKYDENDSNDDEIPDDDDGNESWNDSDDDVNGSDKDINESGKAKKMEFQTYQCYVCFKLYQTKQKLIDHCQDHFDLCNERTLTKCPICNHVSHKSIAEHMKKKHKVIVKIPFNKIQDRKNTEGSRYCYDVNGTIVEVIPSIKILNKTASDEIDKKRRETKDKSIAKTKLVKKGNEWIIEKETINIQFDEIPELTDIELHKCKVTNDDVDRLGQLNYLAKKKGLKMMFPCFKCDKICQNFSALKLHKRRHEDNPKPFKPKVYKRFAKPEVKKKVKLNTANRTAFPKPILNKHKCDAKLREFYETNIRGGDIEFWQFLKIFNKMDREKVNDFKDLEDRTDFGNHLDYYKDVEKQDEIE